MIDANISESKRVKTKVFEPKPKSINLTNISLKSIRKQDPFTYYSIPGIRSAKILGKEIDTSNLVTCRLARSCTTIPARTQSLQVKAQPHTVTRSTRISFECYPDLLLLEELNNEDSEYDQETSGEFQPDLVLQAFLKKEDVEETEMMLSK